MTEEECLNCKYSPCEGDCITCPCYRDNSGPYMCYCLNYRNGLTQDEKCKYKTLDYKSTMNNESIKNNTVTVEQIEQIMSEGILEVSKIGNKTTMVCFTSKEGFEIIETSACVSPENYDEEIGKSICVNKIKDKLWLLEGYCLQKESYKEKHNENN